MNALRYALLPDTLSGFSAVAATSGCTPSQRHATLAEACSMRFNSAVQKYAVVCTPHYHTSCVMQAHKTSRRVYRGVPHCLQVRDAGQEADVPAHSSRPGGAGPGGLRERHRARHARVQRFHHNHRRGAPTLPAAHCAGLRQRPCSRCASICCGQQPSRRHRDHDPIELAC